MKCLWLHFMPSAFICHLPTNGLTSFMIKLHVICDNSANTTSKFDNENIFIITDNSLLTDVLLLFLAFVEFQAVFSHGPKHNKNKFLMLFVA